MEMNFNDLVSYNQEMAKSWYDKIGFIDKIYEPIDVIVDFGCADGAVTRFIKSFYNGKLVIGYDLPEVFAENGITDGDVDEFGVMYIGNLNEIEKYLKRGKSLLVVNSVFHEIFNYMDLDGAMQLVDWMFSGKFDYVWIRDMYITDPVSTWFRQDAFNTIIEKVMTDNDLKMMMDDFINVFGEPHSLCQLTHFLLKHRFKVNWKREVEEDYQAFRDNFWRIKAVMKDKYEEVYKDIYLLPYVNHINKVDFGVSLDDCSMKTHFRAVYKKIEN